VSGITPILDTLLHQVLGRRDTPVDRPLPDQLIAPPRAGLPPQSAHSDSRLDPRPLPTARTAIGAGDKVDGRAATPRNEMPAHPVQAQAVTTRFSTAARIIADVLARFPASPSAIRAQAPLVAMDERTNAVLLAAQLRGSIESSGLFYEAHLLRWHGGALALSQLLREPQMLWSGRAGAPPQAPFPQPQGNAPAAALPPHAGNAAPAQIPAADPPPPPNAPAAASQGYGADGKPLGNMPAATADSAAQSMQAFGQALAFAGDDHVVHSALEGVLRHQLEMLAAPVLRWEGAPWAGVVMALTLQPPYQSEQEAPDEEGRSQHEGEAPWQTHLTLRLARLGEVKVNLKLGAKRIALDFEAEPDAADRMDAQSGTLRERLGALGFHEVTLRIHAHDPAGGGDD